MKKRNAKVMAMMSVMAAGMMMTSAVPVLAARSPVSVGGTVTTQFDKYLVMDAEANVPNVSFTYAITAGTAQKATDGHVAVLAGVDADMVTMAGVGSDTANTIAFKQGDATSQDANALVKNYDKSTEKYAKKTATLDFSACDFTQPGVYRYVITESGTNQAVTNDADATRIVDVYVEETDAGLSIAGYVLHATDDVVSVDGTNPSGKSQGFTNEYDTSNLTIRKEVSGNQAAKTKYFKFTVNITGAVVGTVYNVDITGADSAVVSNASASTNAEYTGKMNPTSITVGEDGSASVDFYLCHGQQVVIQGIAKDTKYNVSEVAEDYTSKPAAVEGYKDGVNGTVASADLKTSYLNTRSGQIPTGVMMTVAPFAVVTLLGGAGVVTMTMKKKRQ